MMPVTQTKSFRADDGSLHEKKSSAHFQNLARLMTAGFKNSNLDTYDPGRQDNLDYRMGNFLHKILREEKYPEAIIREIQGYIDAKKEEET